MATRSYAISEMKSPDAFVDVIKREILPQFDQSGDPSFLGKKDLRIPYRVFEVENEKAALVIVPGRGEPIHKYAELIHDLKDLQFSIYIAGHRLQGDSELENGCKIQYVEDYNDYVEDFTHFMKTVVLNKSKSHPKLFMLAHSMGGAIGSLYAAANPGVFDGIAFSSPMFDMITTPFPKPIARLIGKLAVAFGEGKRSSPKKDTAELNTSEDRKAMSQYVLQTYAPDFDVIDVSYGWALNALYMIDAVQSSKSKITAPILLLQAGRDLHVWPQGQEKFCYALANCQLRRLDDSRHELLMENDTIRNSVLESNDPYKPGIKDFFRNLL